ncbi:MAG: hydroxymethylbilane synthase, partial [Rickettsiales bacterium]|nr:hydroxymethylbilane synthase [Rickettsiales bacterium]
MISNFNKIVVGSRTSNLARKQVDIFLISLKKVFGREVFEKVERKFFKTSGDNYLEKNIPDFGYKGMFTKEIDQAQVRKEVDVAVHSLKDLPTELPKELEIAAVLKRESSNDVVFSEKGLKINEIKPGSVIGTSSIRRLIQIKKYRPELKVKEIRGNIETRIKKVLLGDFDAIILAEAGLRRLNIFRQYQRIEKKTIVPAASQGAIGLVVNKTGKIGKLIKKINHSKSFLEVDCERSFLNALNGSCKTPIGANAKLIENNDKRIFFRYMVSSLDGKKFTKGSKYFDLSCCKEKIFEFGKK